MTAGLLRIALVLLGLGGIAWSGIVLPAASRHAGPEALGRRILAGEPFRVEALAAQRPALDAIEAEALCRAPALRAAALIRFRLAEETLAAGDRGAIDERLGQLRRSLEAALSCGPSDPFLWLALFWTRSTADGFAPEQLELLRLSYRTGPHEGYVALRRLPAALAIFPGLPSDLAEAALAEFVGLVRSDFLDGALDALNGPGWPLRNLLLSRLAPLPQAQRERFAHQARRREIDIAVPGVALPPQLYRR